MPDDNNHDDAWEDSKTPPEREIPQEDTLRIILREAKEQVALATSILESGKLPTNEFRIIQQQGSWLAGTIYKLPNVVEVALFMGFIPVSDKPPLIRHFQDVTYIGLTGKAIVWEGQNYMTILPSGTKHVPAGVEHSLEVVDSHTKILSILIGKK